MFAQILRELMAAGLSGEALLSAFQRIEDACPPECPVDKVDISAERRRAYDRERKRKVRGKSADVRGIPPDSADMPIYKKRYTGKASTIPPDTKPSEVNIRFALSKGLTAEEASKEFERFRDHALAKGRTARDWDAAWRNWVNSPYRKANNPNGRPLTPAGNPWPEGIT